MKNFEINTYGIFSIKEKTKDFYKIIIIAPTISVLFLLAFIYTVDNKVYLLFLVIFEFFGFIFGGIIVPISLKVRINLVVRGVEISNNQMNLVANKTYTFVISELKFKEVKNRFTGFSTINKSGILIKSKEGGEFWIIEDFYNNYEELRQVLLG